MEDLPVGRPHKESNKTVMTQPSAFFRDAALGFESKVLEAVKQDRNMLDLQCHLQLIVPTINGGLVWVMCVEWWCFSNGT